MLNFKLFEAGSLGSGGISEAASLGEQRWSLSAGVLGETAPVLAAPTPVGVETQTRPESLVAGMEEWEEHFGFMHNVEMCVWGKGCWWFLRQLAGRAAYLQPLMNRFNTISLL